MRHNSLYIYIVVKILVLTFNQRVGILEKATGMWSTGWADYIELVRI